MSESHTITRAHWIVLAAAFLGWMFDGVEIGLFPLIVRPAMLDMGMTSDAQIATWNSVMVACFLVGAAVGGVFFGWLGDKIGRVRAMVIAVLAYSLFTGACYFAMSPWHLGVFRFLASLGMGGEWAVAVALVMECWPEQHRPKLAGAIGMASNVGFLLIALVAFAKPVTRDSWRWMMLVGGLPALLALLMSLVVPESQRWKQSRAKSPGGNTILEVFSPRLRRRTLLAIVFSAIPLIGTWAAVSGWIPVWVDQMTQANMARTLLNPDQLAQFDKAPTQQEKQSALKSMLTEEQLNEVARKTAHSKAGSQISLGLGAILACFLAPVIAGHWGRRPVYFALCLLSLLSCGYLFLVVNSFDAHFLITAFFVGGLTAAFYGWLPLYLPEVFPTRVRATGQGLSYNFGRLLAAVGTLYMGQLVGWFGGDYSRAMAAISLIYVVGLIMIWFTPETRGKPLPE